jgi:thiol-disulfide isomerase/thioredoxin
MQIVLSRAAFGVLLASLAFAQEGEKKEKADKPKASQAPYTVGSQVDPQLKLRDLDGNEKSIKDFEGKVVLIHFWSTTCPWEKEAEPKFTKIEKDYAEKGVVVLAVNSNQREIGPEPKGSKGVDAAGKGSDKTGGDKASGRRDQDAEKGNKTYASVRDTLEKKGLKFHVYADHGAKIADAFAAKKTPHCFVIDQKGVLRYEGALDGIASKDDKSATYVTDALDAVLAGKEVKVKTTAPYG